MVRLLLCSVLIGICQSLLGFMYVTFEERFPDQQGIMLAAYGCAMAGSTLSELPVFFWGMPILNKIGADGMLLVSTVATILRMVACAFLPMIWLFAGAELLFNGPMYAAAQFAGMHLAARLAPLGLEATSQALFGTAFNGAGGTIGLLAGGFVMKKLGSRWLFSIGAGVGVFTFIAWIINIVITRRMLAKQAQLAEEPNEPEPEPVEITEVVQQPQVPLLNV
jgi:hypothetical protein